MADTVIDSKNIRPTVSFSERFVILPEDCEQEDNYIGNYMATIAKKLNLKVYLLPYKKTKRDVSGVAEKLGLGIYLSLLDFNKNIKVKERDDIVEQGRSIVRAQQTIRLFSAKELGPEALTKNHRFFGNNPGEYRMFNNREIPVVYTAKELGALFAETDWEENLRQVLLSLVRESAQFLGPSQQYYSVSDSLITKELLIHYYASIQTSEEVGKGRRKRKVKVLKVPKRPSASPLLTKKEMDAIIHLSNSVFTDPMVPFMNEGEEWVDFIIRHSFKNVRKMYDSNYSSRASFLQNFARLTTNRLKEFRNNSPDRQKKKKDITNLDVNTLLSIRKPHRLEKFAKEVSSFDPSFTGFLASFRVLISGISDQKTDYLMSLNKLISYLKSMDIYEGKEVDDSVKNTEPETVSKETKALEKSKDKAPQEKVTLTLPREVPPLRHQKAISQLKEIPSELEKDTTQVVNQAVKFISNIYHKGHLQGEPLAQLKHKRGVIDPTSYVEVIGSFLKKFNKTILSKIQQYPPGSPGDGLRKIFSGPMNIIIEQEFKEVPYSEAESALAAILCKLLQYLIQDTEETLQENEFRSFWSWLVPTDQW